MSVLFCFSLIVNTVNLTFTVIKAWPHRLVMMLDLHLEVMIRWVCSLYSENICFLDCRHLHCCRVRDWSEHTVTFPNSVPCNWRLSFLVLLWESIGWPETRSMNLSLPPVCVSLKGDCELFISESIGTEHNYHLLVEISLGLCQYFLIANPTCALHSHSWISRDPSDTHSAPLDTSSAAGLVLMLHSLCDVKF